MILKILVTTIYSKSRGSSLLDTRDLPLPLPLSGLNNFINSFSLLYTILICLEFNLTHSKAIIIFPPTIHHLVKSLLQEAWPYPTLLILYFMMHPSHSNHLDCARIWEWQKVKLSEAFLWVGDQYSWLSICSTVWQRT